jgi:hypothetical protein
MSRDPLVVCPFCKGKSHARPYDIGSGPELSCPHCEMCWGANGQDLLPLDHEAVKAEILAELGDQLPEHYRKMLAPGTGDTWELKL